MFTTPPTPPVSGVPPTRTATIASSRNPLARFASPPDSLTENISPAMAAKVPEIPKARIFILSTFSPDATAASSPEPTAFKARPNVVRVCKNHAMKRRTPPIINSCGMPNELPNIHPKLSFRNVASIDRARSPERYLAPESATKPIANVETKDGT